MNCLRASYRTVTEMNKRISIDEKLNFVQGYNLEIESDDDYKEIIMSFPWITYRSDFEKIDKFTTDSGWGCMLRVGQMMLAYTFMQLQKMHNKQASV